MADERRRDALNQYWNDMTSGATPQSDLDPEIRGALDWAMALDDVPGPDASFVAELEEELTTARPANFARTAPERIGLNGHGMSSQERSFRVALPVARTRRRWSLAQLAVAAILLLVGLGIGYVAFGPGWPDDDKRITIPAAVQPAATPSPVPFTEETVLSLTLPVDALPKGDGISAGLALITIPPGTQSRWLPPCCNGPLIEYIMSGNYTVRAEDPIRIVRSGGAIEEIPAGVEVTLGPGDSLISRNETAVEAANTGDVPVEMLGWVLIEAGNFNGHSLPGWIMSTVDVQFELPVSPSPATVRLLRIELDGESTYPASPPGTLAFVIALPMGGEGTPTPTMTSKLQSGEVVNTGKSVNVFYLLTMEQAVSGKSSPVAGSPKP